MIQQEASQSWADASQPSYTWAWTANVVDPACHCDTVADCLPAQLVKGYLCRVPDPCLNAFRPWSACEDGL